VYIETLIAAVAASWTSSSLSSSSSSSIDSFLPCGVLLDESCGNNEVFLADDEKKRIFEKECEATGALVRISGMLVDFYSNYNSRPHVSSVRSYKKIIFFSNV